MAQIQAIRLVGIEEIKRTLAQLPEQLLKQAEKDVLKAGAKPVLRAAKARVPTGKGEHKGLLKKSLGTSLKKLRSAGKSRSDTVHSIRIGPRTGFRVALKDSTANKDHLAKMKGGKKVLAVKKGAQRKRFKDPVKYSHLVEYGTSRSAATPFIRPAIEATKSEVVDAMAQGLERHLTKVCARLASGKKVFK